MNRRSFFSTLAKATAGFMILPPATTYQRVWRAQRVPACYRFRDEGIYALLKECGEVVELSCPDPAMVTFLNSVFLAKRIPKSLIPS